MGGDGNLIARKWRKNAEGDHAVVGRNYIRGFWLYCAGGKKEKKKSRASN